MLILRDIPSIVTGGRRMVRKGRFSWLPIVDEFRTLVACMPAELRVLFHEMDGMFPAVFRHGWARAEATGDIREGIKGVDRQPRAEL